MNEFVEQFLIESRELVEQATADLLALEENPADSERLDGAFRAFHTLKGSAGIVDFAAMAKATHAAEDVLAHVRSGKAKISRALISDCLSCLDLVVQWLDGMEIGDGAIPADADARAMAMAQRFAVEDMPAQSPAGETSGAAADDEAGQVPEAARRVLQAQRQLLLQEGPEGLAGRLLSAGRVAINVLKHGGRKGEATVLEKLLAESAAAENVRPILGALETLLGISAPEKATPSVATDAAARVLRVDVERIDAIVKLTGELTVAKNAVGHAALLAQSETDPRALALMLKDQHAALERLVGELQRSVLGIRVLPLRHVFQRFPRLMRELSETLGKAVRLETEGEATEADKVVVENLFEPLLHVVRNALDHGIETAAEREAAGKPVPATVVMRAVRSGEHVLIEVEDDGRGIDVARVRAVAAARGVMDADALAALTDAEAIDLIFAAGFSTATAVTDLSGRGVGMNVVRTGVERLGGTATLASRPGQGAVVTLRLPFSVMMTKVMTVSAGGQMFAIPLDNVVETARVPRAQISPVGAAYAFVLRDRTIPLIDLADTLGTAPNPTPNAQANVVVVSWGGQIGSLEVDRFGEQMDIMLKPMDGLLSGMRGVAGTSLLGDGGVLIVLDLQDLLQ